MKIYKQIFIISMEFLGLIKKELLNRENLENLSKSYAEPASRYGNTFVILFTSISCNIQNCGVLYGLGLIRRRP